MAQYTVYEESQDPEELDLIETEIEADAFRFREVSEYTTFAEFTDETGRIIEAIKVNRIRRISMDQ